MAKWLSGGGAGGGQPVSLGGKVEEESEDNER